MQGNGTCGVYTGPVDLDLLPHGEGTLVQEDLVSKAIWIHGCTAGIMFSLFCGQNLLTFLFQLVFLNPLEKCQVDTCLQQKRKLKLTKFLF